MALSLICEQLIFCGERQRSRPRVAEEQNANKLKLHDCEKITPQDLHVMRFITVAEGGH